MQPAVFWMKKEEYSSAEMLLRLNPFAVQDISKVYKITFAQSRIGKSRCKEELNKLDTYHGFQRR